MEKIALTLTLLLAASLLLMVAGVLIPYGTEIYTTLAVLTIISFTFLETN